MRISKLLPTTLGLLLVAAAIPALAETTETNVQELAEQWTQAYNRHDRDALAALYTEDANLMMHGLPTVVGRTDIGDFWIEDFQDGNPLTLLIVTHAVEGVDMILVHGDYQVIDRDDGSRLGQGRFAHIWTLDVEGNWLLDRDLWNQPHAPLR